MVQGYYTLQEAAQVLGMPPEELKQMAQRNQIRSFQDRGTWRFRVQDIQELARQRGASSDMELVLGDPAVPRSTDSPLVKPPSSRPSSKVAGPKSPPPAGSKPPSGSSKTPRTPRQTSDVGDVFDFALDDENVGIGRETPSSKHRAKPESSKRGVPSPPPAAGSDSDVRLVKDSGEGSIFDMPPPSAATDSDVRLVSSDPGRKSPRSPVPHKPGAPVSPMPKSGPRTPPRDDSGVRLVGVDSDSDVKIVGAGSQEMAIGDAGKKSPTDSDIRLESAPPMSRSEEGLLTEEIDLDAELKKEESVQRKIGKIKPKSKLERQNSPFELSDSSVQIPAAQQPAKPDSSDFDLTPAATKPDSSDFDLTPAGAKPDSSDFDLTPSAEKSKPDSSDFDLNPAALKPDSSDFDLSPTDNLPAGSSEFELDLPEGSDVRASPVGPGSGPASGISLDNPVDAGISLEQVAGSAADVEFDLDLDVAATPKPPSAPAPKKPGGESSEFELSLDVDAAAPSLESPSDSEFELTLDDSGSLAPEGGPPQVKGGPAAQEKDIFESDFEVPALEEESSSQVAALETDLDSSDFDLALGDSDLAAEEESGSQVVALDEDVADEAAATVAGKRGAVGLEEETSDFDQIAEGEASDIEIEEEVEAVAGPAREVIREKVIKPAPWGIVPVLLMVPCVVITFLVGIMGFELVQNMTGYHPPGVLTKTVTELIGQKLK